MSFRRFAGLAMALICFLAFYHIQQGDLRQQYEPLTRPFEGYRQRLGTLLPTDKPPLSRTLGVGRVYVIGPPSQHEDTLLLGPLKHNQDFSRPDLETKPVRWTST